MQKSLHTAIDFIRHNGLTGYEVLNENRKDSYVFRYNPSQSPDENLERLRTVMAITPGQWFTLVGWTTNEKNRVQYRYEFANDDRPPPPPPPPCKASAATSWPSKSSSPKPAWSNATACATSNAANASWPTARASSAARRSPPSASPCSSWANSSAPPAPPSPGSTSRPPARLPPAP